MKRLLTITIILFSLLISCSTKTLSSKNIQKVYKVYLDEVKTNLIIKVKNLENKYILDIDGFIDNVEKEDLKVEIYADVFNKEDKRIDELHLIKRFSSEKFNIYYEKELNEQAIIKKDEILVLISKNGKAIATNNKKLFDKKFKSSDDEKRCKCRDFRLNY